MRIAAVIVVCMVLAVSAGCSRQPLNEKVFEAVWDEYVQREFEEGFDEKKSISQREDLLREVLRHYRIEADEFKQYMSTHHQDKYNKIFLNQ
jgi:hypothetical protein